MSAVTAVMTEIAQLSSLKYSANSVQLLHTTVRQWVHYSYSISVCYCLLQQHCSELAAGSTVHRHSDAPHAVQAVELTLHSQVCTVAV